MKPRTFYICEGYTRNYRTVLVDGYQQMTSFGGFTRLNGNVPYNMIIAARGKSELAKVIAQNSYDYVYHTVREREMVINQEMEQELHKKYEVPLKIKIDPVPINLYDYYKEIGYDRKKKHFNGYTLRQSVIIQVKESMSAPT